MVLAAEYLTGGKTRAVNCLGRTAFPDYKAIIWQKLINMKSFEHGPDWSTYSSWTMVSWGGKAVLLMAKSGW